MIVARYASGVIAVECLVLLFFLPRGVASTVIAALFFVLFLIFCGTYRTSRKVTS